MTERTPLKTLLIDDTPYETQYTRKFEKRRVFAPADPGKLHCVIPGIIQKIHVVPGKTVVKGEPRLVLEAMKMANDIVSPLDGRVKAVFATVGKMVTKGELLLELEWSR
jgi:biotin carboxyl carrier protein